jgi:hypothetical protein
MSYLCGSPFSRPLKINFLTLMSVTQIKQVMRRLSPGQLKKLDEWLQELIGKVEDSRQDGQSRPRKQILEERTVENKTYRLEQIRCGKEKCKCARGKLHGPYWYSYMRVEGKVKSEYVGKKLPREAVKSLRLRNDS